MFSRYFVFRYKQRIGYAVGLLLSIAGLFLLIDENHADWHSPGPANSGHEKLSCTDCHWPAEGSARQQIQANLKQQLGLRQHDAYFQFAPVANEQCVACHERSDDQHPVTRFNEPRFAEVREKLHPEQCASCHAEHQGVRVTLPSAEYCRDCHAEFSLKHDKLNVPHQTLAKQQRWQTCLGCHDYHGNHKMTLPAEVGQEISPNSITEYFKGGQSPYPGQIIHKAKEKRDEQ